MSSGHCCLGWREVLPAGDGAPEEQGFPMRKSNWEQVMEFKEGEASITACGVNKEADKRGKMRGFAPRHGHHLS